MSHEISAAAILSNHLDVSNAIRELQRAGCELSRISVVGKDAHVDGRAVGYYNTGHRLNYWGTLGAFWGGLWGMLNGSAFFVIPGVGQVLVAGPLVASIVNGMEGEPTVPPQNALSAGLFHSKIHKDRLAIYETAVRGSKFVIFAHGAPFETFVASKVLTNLGHEVHALASVKEPYTVEATPRVVVIEVI
jgi:hypothetical protein